MKIEYFGATWCAPCEFYKPIVESLEAEYEDVEFVYLDVDQLPPEADAYNVLSLPTVIFTIEGVVKGRIEGSTGSGEVRALIEELFYGVVDEPPPVNEPVDSPKTDNDKWLLLLLGFLITKMS